jgi:probable HAF family extracellular repeat protein
MHPLQVTPWALSFSALRRGLSVTALMVASAGSAAAATYHVTDLATFEQGTPMVVRGPNNDGVGAAGGRVLGSGGASGQRRGFLLRNGNAQAVAGLPGSDNTVVLGINDAGAFVGSSNTATTVRAIVGASAAQVRELAPLAGDKSSVAFAVNNFGTAVGYSSGAGGQRAVMWTASGTPTALPGATGLSRATSINQRGDIAGSSGPTGAPRAVVWRAGQGLVALPLAAGQVAGEAYAINARGDAAGYSSGPAKLRRATLWPSTGGVIDLGVLPGGAHSLAYGANDAGTVVGISGSSAGDRAFIWTQAQGLQDLNALIAQPAGFVLTGAMGINAQGTILAIGHTVEPAHSHGGHTHERDNHDHFPARIFLLTRSGGAQ